MRSRSVYAWIAMIFFVVTLTSFAGCTMNQMTETSERVSSIAGSVSAVVPPQVRPFLLLISALAGSLPPVILAIAKFKETRKLKKAIVAKSDQIDKVIVATSSNPEPNKTPILALLKADMRLADGERQTSLNYFDKVRKGNG